jgi:hypothetical protein
MLSGEVTDGSTVRVDLDDERDALTVAAA